MERKRYKRKKIKHKSTIDWEKKFLPLLRKHHGTHSQSVFHRLMKKSSTLRSTLKRRSKEYEVEFNISLATIRELFLSNYGSSCKYCTNILTVANMVCDHVVPLSCGGPSTLKNVEMVCRRCNTRKGPLTHKNFNKVLKWLSHQEIDLRKYILRKLSSRDF